MANAKPLVGLASAAKVLCKMFLTSCSMDKPWRAARKRKLALS
jgi:hypothetical protein